MIRIMGAAVLMIGLVLVAAGGQDAQVDPSKVRIASEPITGLKVLGLDAGRGPVAPMRASRNRERRTGFLCTSGETGSMAGV